MLLTDYLINHKADLLSGLEKLNRLSGSSMTLFVQDNNGAVIGALTDGDIRRALIGGAPLSTPVADAAKKDFKAIRPQCDNVVETLRSLRERRIMLVPVLDANSRLVDIIDLSTTRNRLPLTAILMAGGKGERLRPLTLTRPKPLLEIEGKAIIDYNIEALAEVGISNIWVSTNYLAEQLYEHFDEPVAGVKVNCVRESQPLGTIGSATLVPLAAEGDSLVMNSDLITNISFEELYLKHVTSDADITIAVIPYQVAIPFAILSLEGESVTGLQEKPSYSYYANAGIYIMRNSVLRTLSPDTRTDATDLIEQTIARGGRVSYYPIKGTWIDVGSPTDFRQAAELMRHQKGFNINPNRHRETKEQK